MNVLIASFGTRGDIAPFVSLSRALVGRGHAVTLCGPPDCEPLVNGQQITFIPAGDPYAGVAQAIQANPASAPAILSRQVPMQFATIEPLIDAADIVLTGSIEYATPTLCESANKIRRCVLFSPAMLPGDAVPMPMLARYNWPTWLNRLSWQLADFASALTIMRPVAEERKRRGLPKMGRASLHIVGDEVWVPFPKPLYTLDVPGARQFDPWIDELAQLPSNLLDFLKEGPPPLYLGLWTNIAPEGSLELMIDAANRLGMRLVAQGKAVPPPNSHDFFWIDEPVSHRTLFPCCACIIHHGGAGTTISATASGRPQVVVPVVADQFFHARLVQKHRLGVSLAKVEFNGMKAAKSIQAAIAESDSESRERLAAACRISGAEAAVHALESLVAG